MEGTEAKETNRDRVRRVLLNPLGFRAMKGADPDATRKMLDGLADELSYMSEERLNVLRQMLQSKGEGSSHNIWPARATFIALAEIVQPRPLEELPALVRWFRSKEGQRMVIEGTLVETWEYFQRSKVPPFSDAARKTVLDQARSNQRRLQIVAERRKANWSVDPEDAAFELWYLERRAYCDELVKLGREEQGDAA